MRLGCTSGLVFSIRGEVCGFIRFMGDFDGSCFSRLSLLAFIEVSVMNINLCGDCCTLFVVEDSIVAWPGRSLVSQNGQPQQVKKKHPPHCATSGNYPGRGSLQPPFKRVRVWVNLLNWFLKEA